MTALNENWLSVPMNENLFNEYMDLRDKYIESYVNYRLLLDSRDDRRMLRKEAQDLIVLKTVGLTPRSCMETLAEETELLNSKARSISKPSSYSLGFINLLLAALCLPVVKGDLLVDVMKSGLASQDHTQFSYLGKLPDYCTQFSENGNLLFLGPSFDVSGAFAFISNLEIELECLDIISKKDSYNHKAIVYNVKFNYSCQVGQSRKIKYTKVKSEAQEEVNIHPDDLPNLKCDGKHLLRETTFIFPYPPGLPVLLCMNGSIYTFWDQHNTKDGNCSVYYWRNILLSCQTIGSRKLLSLSCEIDIHEDKQDHIPQIDVSLHGSGEIKVMSNLFVKTVICHDECTIPIPGAKFVRVTCPDGSEYKFDIENSLSDKCVISTISGLYYATLFLCKSSFHPYLFITLLVWVLIGKSLIRFVVFTLMYFVSSADRCVQKTIVALNPELACCQICKGKILTPQQASCHDECDKGRCAYCKKHVSLDSIVIHVEGCSIYRAYLVTGTTDFNDSNTLISRFNRKVKNYMLVSYTLSLSYYIIAIVFFLIILVPPTDASPPDSMYRRLISNLDKTKFSDIITDDEPSLLNAIKDEITACGKTCMHTPFSCECSSEKTNVTVVKRSLEKYMSEKSSGSPRHKLEFSEDIEKEKALHSKLGEKDYQKFVTLRQKHDDNIHHMFTMMTENKHGKNNLVHLPYLTQYLTSWGLVQMDKLFMPSFDSQNIGLVWASQKKEKGRIYLKGSAVGKLKLEDHAGITWKITNPDSSETKSISLYIVESAQNYKLTLKYFTTSRKLSTWYRGACTGACPYKCNCLSQTCISKTWDYDRGWGCNPTWCWTVNGGCSCCGADVDVGVRKWVIGVYEVQYVNSEILFCLSEGNDKVSCQVSVDNEKLSFGDYKVTISKAYALDSKVNSRIALAWLNIGSDFMQLRHPSFFIESPEICDETCVHGSVGDYKTWDLWTAAGIESFKTLFFSDDESVNNKTKLLYNHKIVKRGEVKLTSTTSKATTKLTSGRKNIGNSSIPNANNKSSNYSSDTSSKTEEEKQTSPREKRSTNSRKLLWVSSDTDNTFNKMVLQTVFSADAKLLWHQVSQQSIIYLIYQNSDNYYLDTVVNRVISYDKQLAEDNKMCEHWRYTQYHFSTSNEHKQMAVRFPTMICESVLYKHFDMDEYIQQLLGNISPNATSTQNDRSQQVDRSTEPRHADQLSHDLMSNNNTNYNEETTTTHTLKPLITTYADTEEVTNEGMTETEISEPILEEEVVYIDQDGSDEIASMKLLNNSGTNNKLVTNVPNQIERLDPLETTSTLIQPSTVSGNKADIKPIESRSGYNKKELIMQMKTITDAFINILEFTLPEDDQVQFLNKNFKRTRKLRKQNPTSRSFKSWLFHQFQTLSAELMFDDTLLQDVSKTCPPHEYFKQLLELTLVMELASTAEKPIHLSELTPDLEQQSCLFSGIFSTSSPVLNTDFPTSRQFAEQQNLAPVSPMIKSRKTRSLLGVIESEADEDKPDTKTPVSKSSKGKTIRKKVDEEMSWVGVDIQHTCHIGSWPDCNFNGLVDDIDDKFDQFNKSSRHLSDRFMIKKINLGEDGKGGTISVHPLQGIGMVDFTIQVSGLYLNEKEVVCSIKEFAVTNCRGCYSCSSGFTCELSYMLESPESIMVHLTSESPFVVMDNGGYSLKKLSTNMVKRRGISPASNQPQSGLGRGAVKPLTTNLAIVKGGSSMPNVITKICIIETLKPSKTFPEVVCSVANITLKDPEHKLVKRSEVINVKSHQDPARCEGILVVTCMASNFVNLGSTIWDWLCHGFGYVRYIIIGLVSIFFLGIVSWVIFKLIWCAKLKKTPFMVNPAEIRKRKLLAQRQGNNGVTFKSYSEISKMA